MKKGLVAALCTASMALTACGGSYCDDVVSAWEDVREKACTSLTIESETKAQCEARYDALNDAQKEEAEKTLEAQRDCIEELDECTESTVDAWLLSYRSCEQGGTAGNQAD